MGPIVKHIFFGLLIRLAFVKYGIYQDSHSNVKYTDIDYSVYTDAASYVVNKSSPYLRETYRYTPILAVALTPSITQFESYGKIIFCLFDLLVSYLIYLLLSIQRQSFISTQSQPREEADNDNNKDWNWSLLWIYNPLPIVICTRGSSEAIILAIVLAVIFFTQVGATFLSGILYGFAVHFKPYTLPYCLPLYLALGQNSNYPIGSKEWLKEFFYPTTHRIKLIIGSIFGFGLPTVFCYILYGQEFLEETYFYHLTRQDIKHNFSPYFYLLYLNASSGDNLFIKTVCFLPQLILTSSVALLFPLKKDLIFTLFVQTYCFVIFNKVCTSQYFLWYLCFVPILAPKLTLKWTHAVILLVVWYFAQISWLLPAYYLEFEGRNTFMYIWLESIAFFCANIGILVQIIKNYES